MALTLKKMSRCVISLEGNGIQFQYFQNTETTFGILMVLNALLRVSIFSVVENYSKSFDAYCSVACSELHKPTSDSWFTKQK